MMRQSQQAHGARPNSRMGGGAPPVYRPEPPKSRDLQPGRELRPFVAPPLQRQVPQHVWPAAKRTVPDSPDNSPLARFRPAPEPVTNRRPALPVYTPQTSRPPVSRVLAQRQNIPAIMVSYPRGAKASVFGQTGTPRAAFPSPHRSGTLNHSGFGAKRPGMAQVPGPHAVQRAVIGLPAPSSTYDEMMRQQDEINDLVKSILKRPDAGVKDPASLAGIPNHESIYFVGHASPEGFARFNAAELFKGLKETNLPKTYTGRIVLVGCETGVRRHGGFGASLAGQLAALLSGAGYRCSVVGMSGLTFVLQSGEIRVHNDSKSYRRALARARWNERSRDWAERELAFRKSGVSSPKTTQDFAREKQALLDELDQIKSENSRTFATGSVERTGSDSRYSAGLLIGGAMLVGTLAWLYRQQLATAWSGYFG